MVNMKQHLSHDIYIFSGSVVERTTSTSQFLSYGRRLFSAGSGGDTYWQIFLGVLESHVIRGHVRNATHHSPSLQFLLYDDALLPLASKSAN